MFKCRFCERKLGVYCRTPYTIEYECNWCRISHVSQSSYSKYYITACGDNKVSEEFLIKEHDVLIHIKNIIATQLIHVFLGKSDDYQEEFINILNLPLKENFDVNLIVNKVKKLLAFV